MRKLAINTTCHYRLTVLSQQALAPITSQLSVIPPPPPNPPSVISIDLNTSEGAASDLAIDYFQIICNNNQVKDKYNVRIDKC